MKLLSHGNFLRAVLTSVLLLVMLLGHKCKTQSKLPDACTIIRENYFDSNYYRMNPIDTNKVNMRIYNKIFDKVMLDSSAKCMLMKIYSDNTIWEEYGLYDYRTGKCYYTSIKENNLNAFEESETRESKNMYERMKKHIHEHDTIFQYNNKWVELKKENLLDGGNFELSLISVNNARKGLLVKSYHW